MSRTIVLKPQANKKVHQLLKTALAMDIAESRQHRQFQFVLRKLYKNYQQKMQPVYYQFLSHVEQWHIEWFVKSFEWRSRNFMVKVCHISFPNLKTLTLANLEIRNIEPLAWMDCPCLETMNLSHNCVATLKPLAKTVNRRLVSVYLEGNAFSQSQLESFQNRVGLNANMGLSLEVGKELQFTSGGLYMKLNTDKLERPNVGFELISDKIREKLKHRFRNV